MTDIIERAERAIQDNYVSLRLVWDLIAELNKLQVDRNFLLCELDRRDAHLKAAHAENERLADALDQNADNTMTDIKTRLADALRQHYWRPNESSLTAFICDCGWTGEDPRQHQATLLLSLPGIAIVELPERNNKGGWDCGSDSRRLWLDPTSLSVRTLGETVVHNPRAFAAALLAAANAAEGTK